MYYIKQLILKADFFQRLRLLSLIYELAATFKQLPMKHIKRKTILELKSRIPKDVFGEFSSEQNFKEALKSLKYKDVKEKHALLVMDSGELIRSFFFNDKGRACTIPLANPVLVYFNFAQSLLNGITTTKEKLLKSFTGDEEITEDALRLFYGYFGQVSSFVMMLMTSMESFVNQKLDPLQSYSKPEGNKFNRVYNYNQIQRWIPFSEKITEILDVQQAKSFKKNYPIKQQHLENLKSLRDLIVHTKAGDKPDAYDELYRMSLGFNFIDTIHSVKDFINFYEDNLVEPCPCGIDD